MEISTNPIKRWKDLKKLVGYDVARETDRLNKHIRGRCYLRSIRPKGGLA